MPALQPVAGVLRVVVNQILAGVAVINVMHVKQTSGATWSQPDADSLVTVFRNAWQVNFTNFQSSALQLNTVVGTDLSNALGVVATAPGSAPGGVPNPALPASAACCITWPIPRHYRGGHPRTYLGGLCETQQANANTLTPLVISSYQANAVSFRATINGAVNSTGPVRLVCVHRQLHRAVLLPPTTDELGVPVIDSRIDSQRRRLGRDR